MKFNLKTLREINKLTQKELAEKIGVSRKTIIRYENKQTIPNIIEASKLALVLEVSLDDLIGGMLQS